MPPTNSNAELKAAIDKNTKLLEENNKLLRKLYRSELIGFWVRIAWYTLLIGLPFALYFYVLDPYFTALGADFEVFKAGVSEIPGLKGLDSVLDELGTRSY